MERALLMQFITLSIYILFIGFTFCDGFKLHIVRKLIWFVAFLIICINTLTVTGEFDLTLILPTSTLLAFLLCYLEKIKAGRRAV